MVAHHASCVAKCPSSVITKATHTTSDLGTLLLSRFQTRNAILHSLKECPSCCDCERTQNQRGFGRSVSQIYCCRRFLLRWFQECFRLGKSVGPKILQATGSQPPTSLFVFSHSLAENTEHSSSGDGDVLLGAFESPPRCQSESIPTERLSVHFLGVRTKAYREASSRKQRRFLDRGGKQLQSARAVNK